MVSIFKRIAKAVFGSSSDSGDYNTFALPEDLPDDGGLSDFVQSMIEDEKSGSKKTVSTNDVLGVQYGVFGSRAYLLDMRIFHPMLEEHLIPSAPPIAEGVLTQRVGPKGEGYIRVLDLFIFHIRRPDRLEERNAAMAVIDEIGVKMLGQRYVQSERFQVPVAVVDPAKIFNEDGSFDVRAIETAIEHAREVGGHGIVDTTQEVLDAGPRLDEPNWQIMEIAKSMKDSSWKQQIIERAAETASQKKVENSKAESIDPQWQAMEIERQQKNLNWQKQEIQKPASAPAAGAVSTPLGQKTAASPVVGTGGAGTPVAQASAATKAAPVQTASPQAQKPQAGAQNQGATAPASAPGKPGTPSQASSIDKSQEDLAKAIQERKAKEAERERAVAEAAKPKPKPAVQTQPSLAQRMGMEVGTVMVGYRPTWHAQSQALAAYAIYPYRKVGESLSGGDAIYPDDPADPIASAIDEQLARVAKTCLDKIAEDGRSVKVILPLSFGALSNSEKDKILSHLRSCKPEVLSANLMIEIVAIPAVASPNRVRSLVDELSQFCGVISLRVSLADPSFTLVERSGVKLVSIDLSETGMAEKQDRVLVQKLGSFVQDAGAKGAQCNVWGADRRRELEVAVDTGFTLINGNAFAKQVRKLGNRVDVSRELLLGR